MGMETVKNLTIFLVELKYVLADCLNHAWNHIFAFGVDSAAHQDHQPSASDWQHLPQPESFLQALPSSVAQ